jgi:hypothetical protein
VRKEGTTGRVVHGRLEVSGQRSEVIVLAERTGENLGMVRD